MESIYTYTDFRKCLADFYRERKAANRHFSHRHIASRLGLKSTGHFSAILKGKANISQVLATRFGELLQLRKKEADYFEALVQFNQAKTEAVRGKAMERMLSHKECQVQIVGRDRFEYYSKWHYSALLRLFDFYPFAGDYAALGKLLEPALPPPDAKKAVALLLRLGFLRRKPDGSLEPVAQTLSTGYGAQSEHITSFLGQSVDMARLAIEGFPRSERNISSVHFSVSDEAYRKIEQETRSFRRKIMAIAEADKRPARAYQFSVQVFPISRRYPKRLSP